MAAAHSHGHTIIPRASPTQDEATIRRTCLTSGLFLPRRTKEEMRSPNGTFEIDDVGGAGLDPA